MVLYKYRETGGSLFVAGKKTPTDIDFLDPHSVTKYRERKDQDEEGH